VVCMSMADTACWIRVQLTPPHSCTMWCSRVHYSPLQVRLMYCTAGLGGN
jgi:hypothetical protein